MMHKNSKISHFFTLLFSLIVNFLYNANSTSINLPKINGSIDGFQGMFVFGSSVVDNGNNNFLNTPFKVKYLPYGIDFPAGPTGRFSNGQNVADCLAERFGGLPLVPPFYDPKTIGEAIRYGVNYGSGGSGILVDTGSDYGVASLDKQINNFKITTLPKLEALLGSDRHEFLPRYLFVMAAGNNDMATYILQIKNTTTATATSTATKNFTDMLASTYALQLKRLYNTGVRKFVILSVYPLGCSPAIKAQWGVTVGCAKFPNFVVAIYYNKLVSMISELTLLLPGSEFTIIDSARFIADIVQNPGSQGFTEVNGPCCEQIEGRADCKEGGNVCPNRGQFVYFDGLHTSHALSCAFASHIFDQLPHNIDTDTNMEL